MPIPPVDGLQPKLQWRVDAAQRERMRGEWNRPLMEKLGLAPSQFGRPTRPGTRVGTISAAAAHATGFAPGTPICVGAGEQNCSVVGMGAIRPGIAGFEVLNWFGVLAPARTAPAIVSQLNVAIVKLLQRADVREKLAAEGSEIIGSTPARFAAFLKEDVVKWAKGVKAAGIKVE